LQTRCTVHFFLPAPPNGRRPMTVQGTVRYSILSSNGGGFQLGMSTDGLGDDDRAAINLYIKA
ncbi:MAG TPA: hypothetical protein VM407_06640, partial [Acidovorax sp.]|nr:hypothetical protein [Acidovorax sp.]